MVVLFVATLALPCMTPPHSFEKKEGSIEMKGAALPVIRPLCFRLSALHLSIFVLEKSFNSY